MYGVVWWGVWCLGVSGGFSVQSAVCVVCTCAHVSSVYSGVFCIAYACICVCISMSVCILWGGLCLVFICAYGGV